MLIMYNIIVVKERSRDLTKATAFRKWFPESGKGMILMETKVTRKERLPCYRTDNLVVVGSRD